MATALQGVRLAARGCKCRPATHRYAARAIGRRRLFSTTTVRCEDQGKEDLDSATSAALAKAANAPDAQRGQILEQELTHLGSRIERFKESSTNSLRNRIRAPKFPWERRFERPPNTFLNDEEDEAIDGYPEEDGDDDADLTSLGHGELEHHREMRHYARLAAWEMPMLSNLAKPFEPPTADMPLRFRYTTYMGEQHPAEKKVVVEFCTEDMRDLTPAQREKLQKLAGVRYNPETDIIKMSCEMFESQVQNKRYLGDLVEDLLREAKDPSDTFADVPLDTRHHRFKTKPVFPKEWALTEERQAELAEYREKAALLDQIQEPVDGLKQITEAFVKPEREMETLPGIDAHPSAARGKGRTVAVRR